MGFFTEWIHEPYILATNFRGRVTGSELHTVMLEYLGTIQHQQAYFLMDFTDAEAVPYEILKLPVIMQVINHPNTCWLVVVNPSAQTIGMTQLLNRQKVKTYEDRRIGLGFLRGMVRVDTGVKLMT